MYRTYDLSSYEQVKSLAASGVSGYAIARRLGIPRSTVANWCRRDGAPMTLRPPVNFEVRNEHSYSYLLGSYLGDGSLWQTSKRSWRLTVSCDAAYPEIIEEVKAAINEIVAHVRINRTNGSETVVVAASSPLWPLAFPQHGPGRKHERPIVLEPWQAEITRRHPESLLRGLIHSDGCRCVNRFRIRLPSGRVAGYEYPRYFFSNLSSDIRRIFCDHCDLLGIRWTQSNERNISVSHRPGVELLDGFVGPKR